MEKINIAEILKDCPKGMELDCVIYEDVYFDGIDEVCDIIKCYIQEPKHKIGISFNKYGHYSNTNKSKCVIFPKGKTTWEGFVPSYNFKDGDIVATNTGNWIGITTGGKSGVFIPTYCIIKYNGEFEAYLDKKEKWRFDRFATEEEKQKLFDAIKANGYKWNDKTKTLEKLVEPRFKVGDRIQGYGTHINYPIRVVKSLEWDRYRLDNGNYIKFGDEHAYKLLKFDINTLVPFESKVLVRDINSGYWIGSFYSHYKSKKFYTIGGSRYYQCIPYEGNAHLLGTTDDCDEFFKTW